MAWTTEITHSSPESTQAITFTCTRGSLSILGTSTWVSDNIVIDDPLVQFTPAEDFAKISTYFKYGVTPDASAWRNEELSFHEISRENSKITYQITFTAVGVKCKINDSKNFTVSYQVVCTGYHSAYWGRKNFFVKTTSLADYNRIDDEGEDLQYKQYFNFIDNDVSYRLPLAEYSNDNNEFPWIPKKELAGYNLLYTYSSGERQLLPLDENDYWGTPRFKKKKAGDLQLSYSVNKNTYKISKGDEAFELYYLNTQDIWVKDTRTIPLSVTRVLALVQAAGGGGAGGISDGTAYVGGGGGGAGAAGVLALRLDVLDNYDLIIDLGKSGSGGSSTYGNTSATSYRGDDATDTCVEYIRKDSLQTMEQAIIFGGGGGGGSSVTPTSKGAGGMVRINTREEDYEPMFFWLINRYYSGTSHNSSASGGGGGQGCMRTSALVAQYSGNGVAVSTVIARDCPNAQYIFFENPSDPFTVYYDTIDISGKAGGASTSDFPYIGGGGGASLLSHGGSIYKSVYPADGAGGSGGYAYTAENKGDGQNGGGSIVYLWWPKE